MEREARQQKWRARACTCERWSLCSAQNSSRSLGADRGVRTHTRTRWKGPHTAVQMYASKTVHKHTLQYTQRHRHTAAGQCLVPGHTLLQCGLTHAHGRPNLGVPELRQHHTHTHTHAHTHTHTHTRTKTHAAQQERITSSAAAGSPARQRARDSRCLAPVDRPPAAGRVRALQHGRRRGGGVAMRRTWLRPQCRLLMSCSVLECLCSLLPAQALRLSALIT
jgi:hypothetical protein